MYKYPRQGKNNLSLSLKLNKADHYSFTWRVHGIACRAVPAVKNGFDLAVHWIYTDSFANVQQIVGSKLEAEILYGMKATVIKTLMLINFSLFLYKLMHLGNVINPSVW